MSLLVVMFHKEAVETEKHFAGGDGSRTETDVLVLVAGFAALAGVATMLLGGPDTKNADLKVVEDAVAFAAVAGSWLAIHTTYALRYARHWYAVDRGIDFNREGLAPLSDFVYFAFAIGMSFAVSDTNTTTPAVRRIVWGHAMLSYLFGSVILATTINLVAGLGS